MNKEQSEAILTYLEFNLLKFVEDSERHVHDVDVIGNMYDRAYGILADFERTLDMQMLLDKKAKLTSNE